MNGGHGRIWETGSWHMNAARWLERSYFGVEEKEKEDGLELGS